MNRIFYILLISICVASATQAQTLRAYKRKAAESFAMANYSAALAYYNILLEIDQYSTDALYYGAVSAQQLHAYQLAAKYYQQIPDSLKTGVFEHTDYHLASIHRHLEQYPNAIQKYEQYIKAHPNGTLVAEAKEGIAYSQWANQMKSNPLPMTLQHPITRINTRYADLAPVQKNGSLYYTSVWPGDECTPPAFRIFEQRDSISTMLDDMQNGEQCEQVSQAAFNAAGDCMYYTLSKKKEGKGGFQSFIWQKNKLPNGQWSRASKLNDFINMPNTANTQPCIGQDEITGKTYLYFASDRSGGKKGMDIWRSELVNGIPTAAENLSTINTDKDELTPWFHQVSQTLYFSSNGHSSLGGLDIFKTNNNNNTWAAASNIGYPLNSGYDDLYFTFDDAMGMGFMTSNRTGGITDSLCKDCACDDIYTYNISIAADALTFNKKSNLPLAGTTLCLIDALTGKLDTLQYNANSNDFELPVQTGKNYQLVAYKDNYLPDTLLFDTKNIIIPTRIHQNYF